MLLRLRSAHSQSSTRIAHMPYGDHLEEGSPRGVSLEPLRKLERVRKQEHDTATHVAALRAAVAREKTARSVFVAKERKLDGARSYRAMMDAEKTRIAEALRNEEAASEEEVIDLACRMIKRTSLIFPKAGWGTKKGVRLGEPLSGATAKFAESKSPRRKPRQAPPETGSGWFRLFKRMDDDGSGKITYGELEALVRRDLEVSTTELPDRRLKAVWRALDADGSGYLTAGEFGHFMKRGEAHLQQLHPEQSWKQLLHRERRAQKEAVEEYLRNEMSGGAAADAFASVKAATASEVAEMASAMTRRMHELYVGSSAAWFRLFKHMDSDGSGRVTYGEFAELVRSELEISSADLPEENLKSVWRSLDSDDSGFITTAEFGRFMRKGEEGMGQVSTTWRKKLHAKLHKEREEFEAVLYKEARAMEGVRPASEGDCDDLARVLNRQMKAMFKGNPTWYQLFRHMDRRHVTPYLTPHSPHPRYQLFRHMDTDRTGNITFAELLGLVRNATSHGTERVRENGMRGIRGYL